MKSFFEKFLSDRERAIFGKDFGELWRFGTYRSVLIILMLVLSVLFPLIYLISILATPEGAQASFSGIASLLPKEYASLTYRQTLYYVLINMICPLFFILIPLLSAVIVASVFFVGEKENRTITALLCAACTPESIFKAKFFCAVVNSVIISAVSFVGIAVIASVGSVLFSAPFFLSGSWAIEFFFLSPALSVLGVLFVFVMSGQYRSTLNMIMACGYIVLPFILLFIGQFAGFYEISWVFLLVVTLVITLLDILAYYKIRANVTAEKLMKIGEHHVY